MKYLGGNILTDKKKNFIKYGAIIEARMCSTRLPGKSLIDLNGEPLIKRVIDRVSCSKKLNKIVVATSVNNKDDVLERYVRSCGIEVYRGSEENVLERVLFTAEHYSIENIVELHGDNPFLDPYIIDESIASYENSGCDYISNTLERTFPIGLRVQVFPTILLRQIYEKEDDPVVNEHVTPYFYENPDLFHLKNLYAPKELNHPEIRLTVDTLEDLDFVRRIYKVLIDQKKYPNFMSEDVINTMHKYNIPLLNKSVRSKPIR